MATNIENLMGEQTYFKAFIFDEHTKSIRCRDYNFKIDDWNILRETDGSINLRPLKICSNGFHFCKTIYDCLTYYNIDMENIKNRAIAEIRIGKESTLDEKNSDKFVCREFQIVKLYIGNDLENLLKTIRYEAVIKCYELLNKYIPNIQLTGGISHEMCGYKQPSMSLHEIHDIDFTIREYINPLDLLAHEELADCFAFRGKDKMIEQIDLTYNCSKQNILQDKQIEKKEDKQIDKQIERYEIENDNEYPNLEEDKHINLLFKYKGINYNIDLFVNNEGSYKLINILDTKLRISDPWIALKYKFDYIKKSGNKELQRKHLQDIYDIIKNMYDL